MQANAVYHIFNKSIAGYEIFHKPSDYQRFIWMMRFFMLPNISTTFSNYFRDHETSMSTKLAELAQQETSPIQWIAYCLMPTHFHFVVHQNQKDAISIFMQKLLNSYTLYFNHRHRRKGPLWVGRFKHVECETNEQLLHLTRYVHLNPVTAHLVSKPEDWFATSYHEYLGQVDEKICHPEKYWQMHPNAYQRFVHQYIDAQRELAKIKHLMLD
jgi:putative transposase